MGQPLRDAAAAPTNDKKSTRRDRANSSDDADQRPPIEASRSNGTTENKRKRSASDTDESDSEQIV